MFSFCPIIDRTCAFATDCNNHKHCGIKTGSYEETKIHNITKCPKPKKKKRGRK